MKEEIRDEWARRLESGDYEQGRAALRVRDEYCCLGVLCEMAVEAGVVKRYRDAAGYYGYMSNDMLEPEAYLLPRNVAAWAGLDDTNPASGSVSTLSAYNDSGTSFTEIARIIRAEF